MKTAIAIVLTLAMGGAAAAADTITLNRGQPLCADEDGLMAMLIAAATQDARLMSTVTGCQSVQGGTGEVIDRHPSPVAFMRIVKVRVMIRGKATTGYTIEIDQP